MAENVKRTDDSRLTIPSAGGVAAGKLVQLADKVALALVTIAAGGSGAALIRGEIEYARESGASTAWTVGQVIYLDTSNDRLTHSDGAGANKRAGIAAAAAADGDTTGRILLNV